MFNAILFISFTPWWIGLIIAVIAAIGILHEKEVDEERRSLHGEWRLL